eukprot:5072484-Pyramimonas_sp.AAC.1
MAPRTPGPTLRDAYGFTVRSPPQFPRTFPYADMPNRIKQSYVYSTTWGRGLDGAKGFEVCQQGCALESCCCLQLAYEYPSMFFKKSVLLG